MGRRDRWSSTLFLLAAGACGNGPAEAPLGERLAALDGMRWTLDTFEDATLGPPQAMPPERWDGPCIDLLSGQPIEGTRTSGDASVMVDGHAWIVSGGSRPRPLARTPLPFLGKNVLVQWRLRPDRLDYNAGILVRLLDAKAGEGEQPLLQVDLGHTGGRGRHEIRAMVTGTWLGGGRWPVPIIVGAWLTVTAVHDGTTLRLWILDELGWTRLERSVAVPPLPAGGVVGELRCSGQVQGEPRLDVRIAELRIGPASVW